MTGLRGLRLATPAHPEMHGALTAFRLPVGTDAVSLRQGLWEKYRIEAPIVERPEGLLVRVSTQPPQEPGRVYHLIRVSTHFYNTEEEIDRLAEALNELLPR